MKNKTTTIIAALFCVVLTQFARRAAAQAVVPLSNFNMDFYDPNPTNSDPATQPTVTVSDPTVIVPTLLGAGGYVTLSINIKVNAAAANWDVSGNLVTMGFSKAGDTNIFSSNNASAGLLYFQNNSGGPGVFSNTQFLDANGNFVFGNGGVGGYPYDNADQSAPADGSWVNYSVTIFNNGMGVASLQYLDTNGNVVTNLNGIGSNPQTLAFQVDPNAAFSPILDEETGYNSPAGSDYLSSNATLTIQGVPEPRSFAYLIGGLLLLGIVQYKRQALNKS